MPQKKSCPFASIVLRVVTSSSSRAVEPDAATKEVPGVLIYIPMTTAAAPAAPVLIDTVLTDTVLTDTVLTDIALVDIALTGPLASRAASARMRPSAGAILRCGLRTWLPGGAEVAGQSALLAGRRARGEVGLFGGCNHAAGLARFAMQQRTGKKYLHSTKMYARPTIRIAATSGGAQGPHPARDPV
jgi:hypothetical protein